jgi:hypothetical protein
MKLPDLIVFSGNKDYRYGLIIDKYQWHKTPTSVLKNQYTDIKGGT